MSRFRPGRSYGHRCKKLYHDEYRISWVVDRYYEGDRLRYPRGCERITDEAGARRFCKRWKIKFPEDPAG